MLVPKNATDIVNSREPLGRIELRVRVIQPEQCVGENRGRLADVLGSLDPIRRVGERLVDVDAAKSRVVVVPGQVFLDQLQHGETVAAIEATELSRLEDACERQDGGGKSQTRGRAHRRDYAEVSSVV
jgi:hypothetical protein